MTTIKLTWQIIWLLSLLVIPASQGAVSQPAPMIALITPVEGSTVVSPIEISAEMNLGEASLLRVALTTGQNEVISRQLHRVSALDEGLFVYSGSLPFEIPNENAPGWLSLTLIDSQNRPLCLRSASLIIHASGDAEVKTNESQAPWLVISSPEPGELISGGEIQVTGQVTPLTGNPVFFELYSEGGRVLITIQLAVVQPGSAMDFTLIIPYTVTSEQEDALLAISQSADAYNQAIILDSLPLSISP